MSVKTEIRAQARKLSLPALREKVAIAQIDCGMHAMRLDELSATPDLYSAEIEAVTRAQLAACTWSSEGLAELDRRAKQPAQRPKRPAAPAPADHVGETEPAPAPPEKTPWGWITGGVVAAGALAMLALRKTPVVTRVIRTVRPKKGKRRK